MSEIVSLCGNDVLKLNGRIFSDFIDGDVAQLVYPNDLAVVKTGKKGNSIVSFKNDGRQVDLTLRIAAGSADDKFLNNLLALFKNDPAAFSMLTGEFTKNVGDGAGNVTAITYILSAGVPTKQPGTVDNADGNTEQAVAVYGFKFTNGNRSIGN
jgi:hypothetical protein